MWVSLCCLRSPSLPQVFVETLDKCFENVCELDLIFHMDKVGAGLAVLLRAPPEPWEQRPALSLGPCGGHCARSGTPPPRGCATEPGLLRDRGVCGSALRLLCGAGTVGAVCGCVGALPFAAPRHTVEFKGKIKGGTMEVFGTQCLVKLCLEHSLCASSPARQNPGVEMSSYDVPDGAADSGAVRRGGAGPIRPSCLLVSKTCQQKPSGKISGAVNVPFLFWIQTSDLCDRQTNVEVCSRGQGSSVRWHLVLLP